MLNKEKHQLLMGRILKDIYTDASIAPLLGFKGGTCAYFFYGLPRFSVDLDFDLILSDKISQEAVFKKVKKILEKYGVVKNSRIKRFTVFMLLSYGDEDHNIKVEISIRNLPMDIASRYELKEYLGILMLAAKKNYLFAGKLAALPLRSETAMRDVYDIYYFAKNNWDIDKEAVHAITGKKFKEHIFDCVKTVESIKENKILQGLGELISGKEKTWVKRNLKNEALFLLKNFQTLNW